MIILNDGAGFVSTSAAQVNDIKGSEYLFKFWGMVWYHGLTYSTMDMFSSLIHITVHGCYVNGPRGNNPNDFHVL